MAEFKWVGIDLLGNIHSGKLNAMSKVDLDAILLKQEIGLIKCKEIKPNFLFIKKSDKIKFIQHLSVLLKAEIGLLQSLQITANTTSNLNLKNIIKAMVSYVSEGQSFSHALSLYPKVFDSMLIALVSTGEETGNLASILSLLAHHLETLEQYRKKLRASLLMPVFTFMAFIALMLAIFIFVIPKFQSFFVSFKGDLPTSTKIIFSISSWMNSIQFLYFLIFVICGGVLVYFYVKKTKNSIFFQKILFTIPGLGNFLKLIYREQFLQNLALLLKGGVHMTYALDIIFSKTNNRLVKNDLEVIKSKVISGKNLSLALKESFLFSSEELTSLVEIGESSAEVPKMVEQACLIYKIYVYGILERFIAFLQPLILIVLGLLIAILIFSIYLPLFSLSYMTV